MYITEEDYKEKCCPFEKPDAGYTVPVGRVIEKLDEYLGKNEISAAERHLDYWLNEAKSAGDNRGMLSILNERIGLFRKKGDREKCLETAETALKLVEAADADDTMTAATTYLNTATGYRAFGENDKALFYYGKAKEIYEKRLSRDDIRLAGLYNNFATALTAAEKFDEALELCEKALEINSEKEGSEAQSAITNLNIADIYSARYGTDCDKIQVYLDRAEALLDTKGLIRNGAYAFVCEKCAPVFGYYGYFAAERKFSERARMIYERT